MKNQNDLRPGMEEITIALPSRVADEVRAFSGRYRTSFSGMLQIVLAYYFGDGSDHLRCEYCNLWNEQCLYDLPEGEQLEMAYSTVPLLDKGTVVVGQPSGELGF